MPTSIFGLIGEEVTGHRDLVMVYYMVRLEFRALMLTFRKMPESTFSLDFSSKVWKKGKKEGKKGR